MSSHTSSADLTVERFDRTKAGHAAKLCFAFSALGALISAYGFVSAREQFAFSWLYALALAFSLSVGALFWTILHSATDSEWGILVRRQMENLSSVWVILPVAFLPLIVGCAPILWKWWTLGPGVDPLLDHKAGYLNKPFFFLRACSYFIGLGGVAWLLRRHSVLQDSDGESKHTLKMRKLAIVGLPVLAVCLTFAAVDWLMGLDYHWFSTMWGVYIFAGSAGSSMALLVLVVSYLKSKGLLKAVNQEHYHIMGKFLLAFTVFWAYIGYSQYMLIWYANIPEETIYFKIRNTESWHLLSTILVVGRFFIPFPILLFQSVKKNVKLICGVSVWILLMQALDLYLVVLPSLHQKGLNPSLYDFSSVVAVLGACGGVFFRNLGSVNIFPTRDPRLKGSVQLSN